MIILEKGRINAKTCIVDGGRLHKVLDLGIMPSANNLVRREDLERVRTFPLRYYICEDCSLLQLTHFLSYQFLFTDYLYVTGVNVNSVEHFREMSHYLAGIAKKRDLAYVIASNDGTEIKLLEDAGFTSVIGVEPSNLAYAANRNGFPTIKEFFTYELSKKLVENGKADLIIANNVFAHIPDPKDMLRGMANLINDDGVISIEVQWLKTIIDKLEIETLYAEHYFAWTIRAMKNLVKQVGIKLADTIYMPKQHGGSLRFILRKEDGADVSKLEDMEKESHLYDAKYLGETLQQRADARKKGFVELINRLKREGNRISVWTVPAKVPTLFNFCGITNKEIEFAYEVTPQKIGKVIPKVNIEIKHQDLIAQDNPDYLVVGAWNYWDFALKKFEDYISNGGKLINPLTLEIIGSPITLETTVKTG